MKGKLYGVGVGPGDKELITVKAVRIIKEADYIAAALMKNGSRTAFDIIKEYVKDKPVIDCFMPMNRNFDELEKNYEGISDIIEEKLKFGKNIAFVTLGDPSVYSSYMAVNSIIKKRGYETEIIPGITSFCAAAAKLNISLCERDEPLMIFPGLRKELKENIKAKGTKIIMKSGEGFYDLKELLKNENLIEKSFIVEKCGMDGERIYKNIDSNDEKPGYFSVIIVKD